MWLLRDVVLALPKGCPDIKDYFLTRVRYIKWSKFPFLFLQNVSFTLHYKFSRLTNCSPVLSPLGSQVFSGNFIPKSRLGTILWQFHRAMRPGGGILPYMGYIGMCGPKGYGFSAVLVINRVSNLADSGHRV